MTNLLFSDGDRHVIDLPDHSRATKTPGLRNVGLRARLMSSGQLTDLDQVLTHYERVGFLPTTLKPEERSALLAFLDKGLTDARVRDRLPPFDRPTLRSELTPPGANSYGEPWPGTAGSLPELIAHTPASLGNVDFKLGIGNALGGAPAFLVLGANRARPGVHLRGAPLHVALAGALVLAQPLSGTGARRGVTTFRLPLPADPALIGMKRYAQGFVLDANASGGLGATSATWFELF